MDIYDILAKKKVTERLGRVECCGLTSLSNPAPHIHHFSVFDGICFPYVKHLVSVILRDLEVTIFSHKINHL